MRISKTIAAAAVAIGSAVCIGAAPAADLAPYTKTPVFVQPGYDWTGGYIGVNVGYSFGRSADTSSLSGLAPAPLFTDTLSSHMDGVVGGGQIGYNFQMQNWLWGVETDFQGSGQKSNHVYTCPVGICTAGVGPFGLFPGPAVPVTMSQELDWFGTLRGRVGVVVVPRVLLYATGGLAYGQVDSHSTLLGASTATNTNVGWTAGGGIEGAITQDWSVRLEYLYLDLGTVSNTFNTTVAALGGATLVSGFNSRITDNIVRVGVNYRFSGPVIPKY
jgi:outer membrane immunogenic protein